MDWVEILVEEALETITIFRVPIVRSIPIMPIACMTKGEVKVVMRTVPKTTGTLEALITEDKTVDRQQPMTLRVYCCRPILNRKFPGMILA
jgi:hypothetical protein